jgi:hypothetical protein
VGQNAPRSLVHVSGEVVIVNYSKIALDLFGHDVAEIHFLLLGEDIRAGRCGWERRSYALFLRLQIG